ncbi:hypothetical protein LTR53_018186, partial [Teratosphaeriaceae sp. CCFEE 6253]
MDKNATIKTLKESIAAKHPGTTADRLWIAEIYNHKMFKVYFENAQTVGEMGVQGNDHIFVFELERVPKNLPEVMRSYTTYGNSFGKTPGMESEKAEVLAVPVFMRQRGRYGDKWESVMHPLYVTITREEAQDYDTILKKVLVTVSRQTSRAFLTEDAAESGSDAAVDRDGSGSEEAAQVSDRSLPSEDGYVEVSLGKHDAQEKHTNGVAEAPTDPVQKGHPIPEHFMDPRYEILAGLRNGLFTLKYATGSENMLCASMSSFADSTVADMSTRVKKPVRRASTESVSEASTTSAATGPADGASEESDADDDEDKPDIVLGGESTRRSQTPGSTQPDSDEELPADPLQG